MGQTSTLAFMCYEKFLKFFRRKKKSNDILEENFLCSSSSLWSLTTAGNCDVENSSSRSCSCFGHSCYPHHRSITQYSSVQNASEISSVCSQDRHQSTVGSHRRHRRRSCCQDYHWPARYTHHHYHLHHYCRPHRQHNHTDSSAACPLSANNKTIDYSKAIITNSPHDLSDHQMQQHVCKHTVYSSNEHQENRHPNPSRHNGSIYCSCRKRLTPVVPQKVCEHCPPCSFNSFPTLTSTNAKETLNRSEQKTCPSTHCHRHHHHHHDYHGSYIGHTGHKTTTKALAHDNNNLQPINFPVNVTRRHTPCETTPAAAASRGDQQPKTHSTASFYSVSPTSSIIQAPPNHNPFDPNKPGSLPSPPLQRANLSVHGV